MDLLCPSGPSGTFTLVAILLAVVATVVGVVWLFKNKGAEVEALRAKLRELDDQRRGR